MVLHVFTSLLGGVPLCIPLGLYNGTPLGGTTRGTLEGYPGRVLSTIVRAITFLVVLEPRFKWLCKMIFEIVCDMHCICI